MIYINNVVYIKEFEDGSVYIGVTNNFNARMSQHKYKKNKGVNSPLYNKMNKYNHETSILIESDSYEEILKMEVIVIKNFRDLGYEVLNLTDGGEGVLGYSYERTSEHKNKMSTILKGKVVSDETRAKLSKSLKGRQFNEEWKIELSENSARYMLGKHHSEETKEKMSKMKIGKYDGENHPMYSKNHSEETKLKISNSNKKTQHEKYNKEFYKNNEVRRSVFKRACNRNNWNFDDFDEIWMNNNKYKTKHKIYIYIYKY